MKFPFYDTPNTATITCCHIIENGEPILYVSHDEDDGMWQFLCGKTHETDEAKPVCLTGKLKNETVSYMGKMKIFCVQTYPQFLTEKKLPPWNRLSRFCERVE